MTGMAQVAAQAGVSITTVSHVVNGTRHVNPETKQLVSDAMEALGYRHNLGARALARQSTEIIGLAMSMVTNPFFAELVSAIEQQLREAGYTLVLADTRDDPAVQAEVIDQLLAHRVRGLIVSPLEGDDRLTATLERLVEDDFPLVLLDRRSAVRADQVYSACTQPVRELVEHLAFVGHRRIACVTGASTVMSSHDRVDGYRTAVAELGLDSTPELLVDGRSDARVTEEQVWAHLTRQPDPATALVVTNNQMTLGALRGVRRAGLRIPEDLALVAYDDILWADLLQVQVSAMAQDVAQLSQVAVRQILSRIADPARDPEAVMVPTKFKHRTSCGCGVASSRD